MATALNIREFPKDVLKAAKIRAIEKGVTLREYVIWAVEAQAKAPRGRKVRKGT